TGFPSRPPRTFGDSVLTPSSFAFLILWVTILPVGLGLPGLKALNFGLTWSHSANFRHSSTQLEVLFVVTSEAPLLVHAPWAGLDRTANSARTALTPPYGVDRF